MPTEEIRNLDFEVKYFYIDRNYYGYVQYRDDAIIKALVYVKTTSERINVYLPFRYENLDVKVDWWGDRVLCHNP